MLTWLRRLFAPRWPAGEPLLLADGRRWGTRTPQGAIVAGAGWHYTPTAIICSRCQQAIETEHHQRGADQVEANAERSQDAGI